MNQLLVSDIGALKKALAEATRTDESNGAKAAGRYVELRHGTLETLGAARPHLLTGRRGTGKSTLLHVLREKLRQDDVQVLYLDMETYKDRDYPDVLIEVLLELMEEFKPPLRLKSLLPDLGIRRERRSLMARLKVLLRDPQKVLRKYTQEEKATSEHGGKLELEGKYKKQGASGSVSRKSSKQHGWETSAEFEEAKIQRLRVLAVELKDFFKRLIMVSPHHHAVVFLDDFYFVPFDDQPMVLGYMHQIFKGAGIHLKVGGVGTRLNPFVEGNPPVGMQVNHDISQIQLDVTLESFSTAKRFLEQMLEGVLGNGTSASDIFTPSARDRMVLVCGGAVARDYITLTDSALEEVVDRLSKSDTFDETQRLKIGTEDVQKAARKQMYKKELQAFTIDSGTDGTSLRDRWRDICEFARERNTAFVLVPQDELQRADWGLEVQTLENLRLLHKVGNGVPNTASWQGKSCSIYMLDLGQQSNTRLTSAIPEFWTGQAKFDRLRRAQWVYSPGWKGETTDNSDGDQQLQSIDDGSLPTE